MRRLLAALPALLLAGCANTIEGGPKIGELAAPPDQPPPDAVGVQKSEPVRASAELALQNYEKLLSLPQEPAARAETMRRLADLNLQLDEQNPGTLEQSDARQRRSIELYNGVLTEFPTAANNDRVLYQLSRAYQNVGETAKAEEALLRLIRDYPQSAYIDDAHFRRGELLFKLGQFDDAAVEYKHVLDLGAATPFFQPAQYKYGWAQYRQSNYEPALDVFLTILSRELPPGPLSDPKTALAGLGAGKKDLAQDALRVVSLSFAQLGGGEAARKYFAARSEPAYVALLYANLGDHLVEKRRYTDAARVYGVFIEGHPRHELAPAFQARAIDAVAKGGFVDQVVEQKERYAELFEPKGPYWKGRAATPEILQELRRHEEDLARHYQARGQKTAPHDPAAAKQDFAAATRWYRRLLEQYPQDPRAPELRFLAAEALMDAGDTMAAAAEYNKVVADFPGYDKAPEAAYAALIAYQRHSTEVPEAQRPEARRKSIAAALQLAERFPKHEKAIAALTRAAEDLYLQKEWDRVVATAARVLTYDPPAPVELRRTALSVTGDTHYGQKRFDKAEAAYYELLGLLPPDAAEERAPIAERIAESIYKQAEAWRDAGNPVAAADTFLRIGTRAPGSKIRAAADYDAAAMLILAKDWGRAATVLEAFRATHPASGLLPEVDKKLAVVYQNDGKPRDAAVVLDRIKARETETADVRLEAAWLEVSLLDQARDPKAWPAYEAYVKQYPRPLDRAMEARRKLADDAADRKDAAKRQYWLREIIAADTAAGTARTPRSRQLAAEATLEFARAEAQKAGRLPLKLPLAQSVKAKKGAVERAIAELTRASDYHVAAVTTAATYELGVLYQQFSKSLIESERPRKLSALEREQYDLLLEEQAFPFEEKAIAWHEANLQRVNEGVYSEWIGRSLQALAQLAPGKYGKREQTAEAYDALH
jgi:cellulose synthase operon protein C